MDNSQHTVAGPLKTMLKLDFPKKVRKYMFVGGTVLTLGGLISFTPGNDEFGLLFFWGGVLLFSALVYNPRVRLDRRGIKVQTFKSQFKLRWNEIEQIQILGDQLRLWNSTGLKMVSLKQMSDEKKAILFGYLREYCSHLEPSLPILAYPSGFEDEEF
ncbi:MAG: hypothetical protein H6581_30935 [Bacteroidia bacterium]|nr:hypothetical protein [Bacteroidia bacterium]